MYEIFKKNLTLTPKILKDSPAILKKNYIESNQLVLCHEFLKAGAIFRVVECGFSTFYVDDQFQIKNIKNETEWCKIQIMDSYSSPDCCDFFVKAEDLEPIKDPDFAFE